jgi:hypothetical protein
MHDPDAVLGVTGLLDKELEEDFPDFLSEYPLSSSRAGIELLGSIASPDVYAEIKSAALAVVNCNWRGSVETFCRVQLRLKWRELLLLALTADHCERQFKMARRRFWLIEKIRKSWQRLLFCF